MAYVVIIKNIFSNAMVFFEDVVLLIEPKAHLHTVIQLVRKIKSNSRLCYDTK